MSNQLEVFSEFRGCTKWDKEERPFLEGDIEAFIEVKHGKGTDKMLVINAHFPENDYQGDLVCLPITEELDMSLKMQDAEVDDYIVIDSGVEVPVKYGKFGDLVLINKNMEIESILDYATYKSNEYYRD